MQTKRLESRSESKRLFTGLTPKDVQANAEVPQ